MIVLVIGGSGSGKSEFAESLIKDFDGEGFCLIGEGKLPVGDMMSALRSVNYDGFISLEWDPAWCEGLDDSEIIFSHFVNFISQFGDTSKAESALYYNRAHTGKYVWKKNLLIDETEQLL